MPGVSDNTRLRSVAAEALAAATGREHRRDAVLRRSGGPAGNARLTAWTGLLLLVLFLAELVTTLDVHGLIGWHLAIGALLVPPALVKTATTGWRIARYYTGHRPYREAGPPPLILRVLGPLVVLFTLAVLGTGLVLILVGPDRGRTPLVTVLGQRIDTVTLHQATFVAWAVVTGLHTLGRLLPAVRLTVAPAGPRAAVPGGYARAGLLVLALVVAAGFAVLVVDAGHAWRTEPAHRFGPGHHQRHDRP